MKHSRTRCKKIARILSEYLEEELDAESCNEVIEHMKDCAPCVTFLNSLQKTVEITRQGAGAPVQVPAISEDVRRKLKESYESFRAAHSKTSG